MFDSSTHDVMALDFNTGGIYPLMCWEDSNSKDLVLALQYSLLQVDGFNCGVLLSVISIILRIPTPSTPPPSLHPCTFLQLAPSTFIRFLPPSTARLRTFTRPVLPHHRHSPRAPSIALLAQRPAKIHSERRSKKFTKNKNLNGKLRDIPPEDKGK